MMPRVHGNKATTREVKNEFGAVTEFFICAVEEEPRSDGAAVSGVFRSSERDLATDWK